MREVTIQTMTAEHLMFLLRDMEPEMPMERNERTAEARLATGSSYSFFLGDTLLACGGVTVYWPGMGEVWVLFSREAYSHLVEVVATVPRVIERIRKDHHLRRLQADVVATNEKAINFAKHYGFVAEGLMRCYDVMGRDNIRFARIWEVDDGEPR